jgi:hypothetical protein
MIPAVQAALNTILVGVPTLQYANGAGRIFELFIMSGIAERLQSLGFDVWLQRSDATRINAGDADRRFIQRGGAPTGVQSAVAGPDNASVIGFQRGVDARSWEIWNGIQFRGRSSGLHEIDIAVVPLEVGNALRQAGGTPQGRPRVAIECKDVGRTCRQHQLSLEPSRPKNTERAKRSHQGDTTKRRIKIRPSYSIRAVPPYPERIGKGSPAEHEASLPGNVPELRQPISKAHTAFLTRNE